MKKQNILIHDDQHQYLVVIASDNQVLTIDSFSLNFFVAVLVGQYCWWLGSTVFCGGRTEKMGEVKQTNKDKNQKKKSCWSALHITDT